MMFLKEKAMRMRPMFNFAVEQNLSSANNIKINPVNVLWQIEAMEQVDFTGSTGTLLNDKAIHFFLNTGVEHYFWFNYNSGGTDPAESGTAHAVAVASAAPTATIATDFATAVTAVTGFTAVAVGNVVTVCRVLGTGVGQVSAPLQLVAMPTAVLTRIRSGKDFNLGLLKGDINPKFSPANLTVTAHQFGKTPLASLNQGFDKIECDTKLLETDLSKLQTLYQIYGGTVAGATTNVLGAGTAVLGKNILVEAARLIFKPVNAIDNTQNFNIALALPVPGSLMFSGENPSELDVSWMGFVDTLMNSKINAVNIGDLSQTGLTA